MAANACQLLESQEEQKSSAIAKKDPFVGNVSKVAPLPKGQCGPVEKGQLVFDASFETGETPPGVGYR